MPLLAVAALPSPSVAGPTLRFDRPEIQRELGAPFARAVENLLVLNTVASDPKTYNRTGLMRGNRFFRAGGGYAQPWTRDAAINVWNAGSLFAPEIARDTLWAVTRPDEAERPIVQRDDQWWDKVVWIVGAWHHYSVTGDREFLSHSHGVAERLLREMRASRYSARERLFAGPSFFNDGIAGYPSPPAKTDDGGSSFVLDHPGTDRLLCLSTNVLYVGAYRAMGAMARDLRAPSREWDAAGDALAKAINRRFWMRDRGTYGYLIGPSGTLDRSQEGSGLAFAVLFDVADASRARSVLRNAHMEPFGIPSVWPHFARFSDEKPGRHNGIVWPLVQGLWARAATKRRDRAAFAREARNLARLSAMSEGQFFEIYNARTGAVDGGWQNGRQWGSVPDQTWSATAYLGMVTDGLFGMRFAPDGLRFEPMVPEGWGGATLENVPYRGATLEIRLEGSGARLARLTLDGRRVRSIPPTLAGRHRIVVAAR